MFSVSQRLFGVWEKVKNGPTRNSQSIEGADVYAEWHGDLLREAKMPRRAYWGALEKPLGLYNLLCDFWVVGDTWACDVLGHSEVFC